MGEDMAEGNAKYTFLPWVRQGAAGGIEMPDSLGANQAGVVSVPVNLRVNDAVEIPRQVRLYGPGDVTGIDPQQVVRTDPRPQTRDFEPNYFPAIEFDRPDFPWLFTPAKAKDTGQLRPWLCLVVVRKQTGVSIQVDPNRPLPVLEIKAPADPAHELPDLTESWAWAHAQVTGSDVSSSLTGDPALTVSRLLCPRRLDPLTEYLACVVPAFELGRRAGLGREITLADEQPSGVGLAPAWLLASPWHVGSEPSSEVKLPVYYHWEFRTGVGGDFESLVNALVARDAKDLQEVGKRPLDISQPGLEITPALPTGTTLDFGGALRVVDDKPTNEPAESQKPLAWPNETIRTSFQAELKKILDAPWDALKKFEGVGPVLAPPIYGCWQAARHIVNTSPPIPPASLTWLDELNLDPRHRAVAALGTKVIQTQQEQLMAAAWEQLGEIQRVNQMRRQAQLSRAVNTAYHAKHFTRFSPEALLKVSATGWSRVVVTTSDANLTDKPRALLTQHIEQSAIPLRAISAPLRRMTSPHSAINARFQTGDARPLFLVTKLNSSTSIVLLKKHDAGLVTINEVTRQLSPNAWSTAGLLLFESIARVVYGRYAWFIKFRIAAEGDTTTLLNPPHSDTESPDEQAFRQAVQDHQDYLQRQLFKTGWDDFKFVFSGGSGIFYAVDYRGRLYFRRLKQGKSADVTDPSMIGGGFQDMQHVFSGGNGIIYAVNEFGQLLFYRDQNQDGTGNVIGPSIIGSGLHRMRPIFSGGNGIIYAVNEFGQLLFYRDQNQDGTGSISNSSVIGVQFENPFSGGNGIIYDVNVWGVLYFSRDQKQDGTGSLAGRAVTLSQGGWRFRFIFSDGNGTIYAVNEFGQLLSSRDEKQDGSGVVPPPSVIDQGETSLSAATMNLADTKEKLLQSVNPQHTITTRLSASLVPASAIAQTDDPLEPLLEAPNFPQPMFEVLRDLSQDFLFPGLEHVPTNTVALLETNSKFIESFLVGLNAEMSRELLWRNFPTDQRGTFFRRSWDTLIDNKPSDNIDMIKEWGNKSLGQNTTGGDQLVLLLRGELLRRYPNSVIYAVKAEKVNGRLALSTEESHPVFRGTLKPDVTFLGFNLTKKDALTDPGWFFVIQEQPTEPRFGLDEADFNKPLPQKITSRDDLSWRQMVNTDSKEALQALSHASITAKLPDKINNALWGKNAAHQAYLTLQRPMRIAIHASKMLP
jgi:hypothetical protein